MTYLFTIFKPDQCWITSDLIFTADGVILRTVNLATHKESIITTKKQQQQQKMIHKLF